jgi:hypothetical protein
MATGDGVAWEGLGVRGWGLGRKTSQAVIARAMAAATPE